VSGALHHVVIGAGAEGPLLPNTTYYYSCGDQDLGMSPEFSFTTPPLTAPDSLPYRLALSCLGPGGFRLARGCYHGLLYTVFCCFNTLVTCLMTLRAITGQNEQDWVFSLG
jgi:hypothetical protein